MLKFGKLENKYIGNIFYLEKISLDNYFHTNQNQKNTSFRKNGGKPQTSSTRAKSVQSKNSLEK